ncbi:MAG TPA: molybdenum cofactor guanylyltransferase [Acidimicrobiia bacterium]|nr:molybdenum cofactor guanylyltransferase [Acidimicrobiia bacterium]
MTERPLGAILTGGHSTRMGRDKADVAVAGRPMLDRVAEALAAVSDRVVVLGSDRAGWECWPDSVHAQGPLAGIATALSRADTARIVAVAVDHPFVTSRLLEHLVAVESDLPVVPVDESGVRQVTCAVYPADIAAAARDEATSGGSIQTLLDRVSFRPVAPDEWKQWGEDGRSWFSVDDEEALQRGVETFLDERSQ